jgi:hypothetical protein
LTDQIKTGAILLAEGTPLPASMYEMGHEMGHEVGQGKGQYAGEAFIPGWNWVKDLDSNGMDRLINKAGWNFFYLSGGIEMIAFGADRERASGKALRRIIASLKAKNFNCLEITHVTTKRFLGWPYVSVSAHSRHVQKSRVLFAD